MTVPSSETVVVYREPAPRSSAAGYFALGFFACIALVALVWILASRPVAASDDIGNNPLVIQVTTPAQPKPNANRLPATSSTGSVSGCHYTNPYIDEYVQHPAC